ncbi:MAG: hypothetical protein ACREDZ_06375 [Kiloniellales bacterium]
MALELTAEGTRPPMDAALLKRLASRLYGERRWQAALARELQVNDRTVRRWASGASPVPESVALALKLMVFLDELKWLGEWRKMLDEELL